MKISYELAKVKDAFSKVRNDMNFLSEKISSNYDDFMHEHRTMSKKIEELSKKVKSEIEELREAGHHINGTASEKQMLDLKAEIKELKAETIKAQSDHHNVEILLSDMKKHGKSIRDVKDKLKSSELELFLIKEKLSEKDDEINQLKEVNKHLYAIVEELSGLEIELVNSQAKGKAQA